jgi:hypothetical protein
MISLRNLIVVENFKTLLSFLSTSLFLKFMLPLQYSIISQFIPVRIYNLQPIKDTAAQSLFSTCSSHLFSYVFLFQAHSILPLQWNITLRLARYFTKLQLCIIQSFSFEQNMVVRKNCKLNVTKHFTAFQQIDLIIDYFLLPIVITAITFLFDFKLFSSVTIFLN